MKRLSALCSAAVSLLLYSCGGNAFNIIADENSPEACKYEVSKNLDSGNWDAVLNSSCAEPMDRGAAYFGKAGFDIKDVINRFSEAAGEPDSVNIYLKALVPKVTESTLKNLENAENEYKKVQPDSPYYQDAQFYLSLVSAVKGLGYAKVVIDTDGDGQLLTGCDRNNNGTPDDVDVTACALLVSGQLMTNQTPDCSSLNVTFSWSPDPPPGTYLTLKDSQGNQKSGQYKGIIVNITDQGGPSDGCPSDDLYRKRLLFLQENYYVVSVTTSEVCKDRFDQEWPCPIEENGQPLDLVAAIDKAFQSMVNSMSNTLPEVDQDVVNSINEIRQEACGGDTCTSVEIANYLQKINIQSIQ